MSKKNRFKIPIAVFMILRRDEEILLLQRSNTGWRDGHYSLPAGSLEDGEDIMSAVLRETFEEVGVLVKGNAIEHFHTQHCNVEGQNWINIYFQTYEWEGIPRVCEPHKHSQVAWFNMHDLPINMVEYVQASLKGSNTTAPTTSFGWDITS